MYVNCQKQLKPKFNIKVESSDEDYKMFKIIENGQYVCELPECDYKSAVKSAVKQHIKLKHLNLRTHFCDVCPYIAKTAQSLNNHKEGVHGDPVHICPDCGFQSKWLANLTGHIKTVHHGIKRKAAVIQTCTSCDYTSKRKDLMEKHIKGMHRKEHYSCDKCSYITRWKDGLVRHKKEGTCKVNVLLKHKCKSCDYSTDYFESFKEHSFYIHDKGSSLSFKKNETGHFDCHLCLYTAKKMSNIKRHVYSKHERNNS